MSEARLELVEPCEHGERNNCGVGPHCLECPGTESCFNGVPLHRWCPGGSRRVLFVPTEEMVEAGAIRFCHWDGWDYGEPYDKWPETIVQIDGGPWSSQEDAREDYRDRANGILAAAFNPLGIQET
jgi:hypothetical protein